MQNSFIAAQALDFPTQSSPRTCVPCCCCSDMQRGSRDMYRGVWFNLHFKNLMILHQSHDSWVLPNDFFFQLGISSTVLDLPAFLLYKDFFFKWQEMWFPQIFILILCHYFFIPRFQKHEDLRFTIHAGRLSWYIGCKWRKARVDLPR